MLSGARGTTGWVGRGGGLDRKDVRGAARGHAGRDWEDVGRGPEGAGCSR